MAARELRQRIDRGEDPLEERTERRTAPDIRELVREYFELHLPKKRPASAHDDQRMLERFVLPTFGRRKVEDIGFGDVEKLHQRLKDTPIQANRLLSLLSKLFALAIRWGYRADNPCKGVERFPEVRRKRYLSGEELQRMLAALDGCESRAAADVVRLALHTGARSGEIMNARWDQIDLQTGIWTKPGSTTKQKTEHRVPLAPAALEVLLARKEAVGDTPWVFPARQVGDKVPKVPHLSSIKNAWATICRRAELVDLRLHDCRRSFASMLVSSGHSLELIGALLGHTQVATTKRYSHLYDDPQRQAVEQIGAILTGEHSRG